jgi:hypothetical protein
LTDIVLVMAWLVFAHLVADFVLQNDWIALNKGTGGRTGWLALGTHGFHVALCLAPTVLAFGWLALVYVAIVVVTHMLVDRWKVQATRRAERSALEAARQRYPGPGGAPASGLGSAWTPWPGMLFIADQALHLLIAILGWLIIMEGIAIQAWFADFVDIILRTWDPAMFHAVVLTAVVLVSLFLVNTRGGYYFVLALVSPRELPDQPVPDPEELPEPAPAPAPAGYTVKVGPITATVNPGVPLAEEAPVPAEPAPAARPKPSVPSGAPARIGATIGALERLLIVGFVLVGLDVAVGFVIAAKTIARFKQLDDRGFAEYYLLGTLASVAVAFSSAIIAKAALGTIP